MMKLLVSGSRTLDDEMVVFQHLDSLHRRYHVTMVITGGARGVDQLAKKWALSRGVEYKEMPISGEDWQRFGKAAGPMRNGEMVAICDSGVAFWDGKSRGTLDAVKQLSKAGKLLVVVKCTPGGGTTILSSF